MKLIITNIINLVFVTTVTTTNAWREDQVVMLTSWADPNECTMDNFNNMVDNSNKQQGPYEPDVCSAGNAIPVRITLDNNGTECYVNPNNPNLVFWISRPPTHEDPLFTPSDDLRVTYLYTNRTTGTYETPFFPRSDCNEQGVCVCDAINSIRDSMENGGRQNVSADWGGSSTTPTIMPNSDPTCGIKSRILFPIYPGKVFCTPIQGTLKLISGSISNQGLAIAITAGCITTMIILSVVCWKMRTTKDLPVSTGN